MFPESYDLLEVTRQRYKVQIKVFFPQQKAVEDMVNRKGINLFYESVENRKLCCHIRKIEPLKRALENVDVWISGLRREQSVTREDLALVEWDNLNHKIKLNPLINWTSTDLWDYIRQNNIPYNPLHDQGYPSIGCQPCTRAVEPGEDIRAGRWWWEHPELKECGLHK
jgi:phosphoadenosine phosphosulfate reductase